MEGKLPRWGVAVEGCLPNTRSCRAVGALAMQIHEIFFLPPLAIARVGGSDKPLDAFYWDTDKSIHGANRTVIRPDVTLKVLPDGTLRPFKPNAIQFRDGNLLRPV